jgi:sulfur-oxidizing protein SoxZ
VAGESIKVRAHREGTVATVRILLHHPMETGLRRAANGTLVPLHHITTLTCAVNGEALMVAHWGPGISRDPFLSFALQEVCAGDRLTLSWADNRGETDQLVIPLP